MDGVPAADRRVNGLGDYKAARRTLDRLRGLRPGRRPQARTAQVYRDRGWREDAAAAISDAAARAEAPAEQAAYSYWAGRAGLGARGAGGGAAALRGGAAADPGEHAALAGRGRALAALGRTREAVTGVPGGARRSGALPQYALELGELYESLGRGRRRAGAVRGAARAGARGRQAAG